MGNSTQSTAPRLDYSRVMPVFVLVLVDVLGLSVILPLLHLYAATYGASPLEIGLVAAAFPLAQLVGVPVMGALSDRFGRKPLLLISQITTCLSFIMLGLANSLMLVILSRVLDGLFGANLATAQAALSDISTDETRSQALGLTGAAFGLGFIFGPITAVVGLAISDSLAVPAFTAAAYSFISILLTLFVFKETLPPEKRGTSKRMVTPLVVVRALGNPNVNLLLIFMFAQQLIFFGFESLLGLFTLSQLGILGTGNALLFLFVGAILVVVQVRFIGKWSRKYGDHGVVRGALGLLAFGLALLALTPQQPHPLYVPQRAQYELAQQGTLDATETLVGEVDALLPPGGNNGIGGVLWLLVAIVPLAIGAGLIRPSLNSLMTKRVGKQEYGSILGVSAAFVSAANAIAPLLGGWLFQQYGSTIPFLLGGVLAAGLFLLSLLLLKASPALQQAP